MISEDFAMLPNSVLLLRIVDSAVHYGGYWDTYTTMEDIDRANNARSAAYDALEQRTEYCDYDTELAIIRLRKIIRNDTANDNDFRETINCAIDALLAWI